MKLTCRMCKFLQIEVLTLEYIGYLTCAKAREMVEDMDDCPAWCPLGEEND